MAQVRIVTAALGATLLAALWGCGTERVQAQPQSGFSLTVESSGGFAGIRRSIEVSSDGTLTVRDLRRQTESTTVLAPGDLQELEELAAALPAESAARGPGCPDCITHVVTLNRGGKPVRLVVPAPGKGDPAAEALLARVLEMAAAAENPPNAD